MTQLKDVLHLYMGCEVQYEGILNGKELAEERKKIKGELFSMPVVEEVIGLKRGVLRRIDVNIRGEYRCARVGRKGLKSFWGVPNFKIVLRPLSDMTDEELLCSANILGGNYDASDEPKIMQARELLCTNKIYNHQTNIPGMAWMKLTAYLLSRTFDLFGLIESGQAINKTTLTK